jgi:NAD(P)-dependent dehydrogenase (short-subunit alcohol dehydrogenase family)
MDRLKGKVALIVGAGQTPGLTIGNGRAVAMRFAAEGARVFAVDMSIERAGETAAAIAQEGGICTPFAADIRIEGDIVRMVEACVAAFGRIDILHNNVGVSGAAGDTTVSAISGEVFAAVHAINLHGMVMTCKHVLPLFKEQQSGVVLNVASAGAIGAYHEKIAYKTSKAGVVALTHAIATEYAEFGVRANCILPGLIDTPMAIEARAKGDDEVRQRVRAARDAMVPLRKKMGTAWDVANAAVFLASDEASFITGVNLPVDGGSLARIG